MRIHFVAVAGTGMGALAGLLCTEGHEVSGSDVRFDPPIGPELQGWGIRLHHGFHPDHLKPRPDLVVVGNVCRRDNPEAEAAFASGIRVLSMADALAEFCLNDTAPLVVAGTHGKTTTSSLAAFLLDETGQAPGFFIGGLPKNFPAGFRRGSPRPRRILQAEGVLGRRSPFVVEGDEYDSAFFDKTPKFWHYRPEVAILTSIEHDHIDIYPTEQSYLDAFRGFVERIPEGGLCLAAANDARVRKVVEGCAAKVSYFALQGDDTGDITPEWLAAPGAVVLGKQEFDLYIGGVFCGRLQMSIPGEHNVRNATAAIAAVAEGFHVPVRDLLHPLRRFSGVARRQELLGEACGVRVYDDFAHHPTAVRETLHALRHKHETGSLWAVFEPRSATACRSLHQQQYETAFRSADHVLLAPLGRAQIPQGERLDLAELSQALQKRGQDAALGGSVTEILQELMERVRPGDVVAFLSNGAFGGIQGEFLARLRAREEGT